MVKQRMSSADVAAEVACLRHTGVVGMRLVNIYDLNPRVRELWPPPSRVRRAIAARGASARPGRR